MEARLSFLLLFFSFFVVAFSHDPQLRADFLSIPVTEAVETDHWAIQLAPGVNPLDIAELHGHEYVGTVGNLKDIHLFKKKPHTVHGVSHPHHKISSDVLWFERQIARQWSKRDAPTDPSYSKQWHLHNDGSGNVHINAEPVWERNITGKGIVIGVVDDGLEYTHPDLSPNYIRDLSYDFNYNDPDPYPDNSYDDHGTSAAGVAGAARDNGVCGLGSGYNAGLAGIRLISRSTTDATEASALSYKSQDIHIYSNSWGPIDDGKRLEGPGNLAKIALKNGVEEGRDGKGSIFVWAGGNGKRNGDNCNYDGWANSKFTISVGAVDSSGVQSWYSESCAMLLISAPSSGSSKTITTSDLNGSRGTSSTDCTSTFGGTSAAAPLVAGVVALILEANPDLTWRDVQGVLIHSATKNHLSDSDWVRNGANIWVNHKYGFGLINSNAAVETALSWALLPSQQSFSQIKTTNAQIPDGGNFQSTIDVQANFLIEFVEVFVDIEHNRRGDLAISITSPSNTVSVLAEKRSDTNPNIVWTFASVRHWEEDPTGIWTLTISDQQTGNTGTLKKWSLTIYGH